MCRNNLSSRRSVLDKQPPGMGSTPGDSTTRLDKCLQMEGSNFFDAKICFHILSPSFFHLPGISVMLLEILKTPTEQSVELFSVSCIFNFLVNQTGVNAWDCFSAECFYQLDAIFIKGLPPANGWQHLSRIWSVAFWPARIFLTGPKQPIFHQK